MCARTGRRRRKDLIYGRNRARNVTMSDWIKIGVEFIKAMPGQWKGSSHPNDPVKLRNTMAEETPRADSIAARPESQISTTAEASPNQQEIERRREIVR